MCRSQLFFLLLIITSLLSAQPSQIQTYNVAEGLAQSQVYALLADSRGYLWAGTQGGGLSCFDGLNFSTFSDKEGLSGNYIQALYEDKQGRIWIGTERGLTIYDGAVFQRELSGEKILAISGNGGKVWVLTEKRLWYKEEDWKSMEFPEPHMAADCILVEEERLLLGTSRGLWSWDGSNWLELRADYIGSHQVWALYRYHRGHSWALSPGGQLFTVTADSLRSRKIPEGYPKVFYVSPEGDSWLGTQNQGLFVLPKGGRKWQSIGEKDGLGSDDVRAITADRWGNIWVGTSGGGLTCLREAPFRSFDQNKGLDGREVYAITQVDSLGIFFSVANNGIYRYTPAGPQAFIQDPELGDQKVKTLHRDSKNRWWMGTPGDGIKVKTDSSWLSVNDCGTYVIDMLPAGENKWWVATAYEGLSLLEVSEDSTGLQFSCRSFGSEHELPIGRIVQLMKDQRGRLLIAYRDHGLACWEPGELFWQVGVADGLPSPTVRAVCQDSVGYYWLATPRGLARLGFRSEGKEIKVFQNKDGLQSNNLYCLAFDTKGNLWAGSERGMDRVALDAAANIRQVRFFGKQEGFTGIETCTDAALTDADGNLWVGTMNGLMLHEDKPQRATKLPPPLISIADLRILYRPISEVIDTVVLDPWGRLMVKELTLNYKQNHLGFELRGLDLGQPQGVSFEWQLEGWDERWAPPSKQSSITYANLPPGDYTFHARAVGEGDRKSAAISVPIHIIPAFWQTTWFRVAMIGFGFLLMALLLWRFFRRRLLRQKRIAERLRLDNRLLELEQKALQLQMNPHFLANALQGIQYEIDQEAYTRASQYLAKFGALMRSTLYHSRASTISLSDELDNLKHYLDLERFRTGNTFNYTIELAAGLEVDLIEIPPMLLQPFLENAVHHGMRSKKGDGQIRISFQEEGTGILLVSIEDNGPGLAASKALRKGDHRSTALQVIKERLQLLDMGEAVAPYHVQDLTVAGIVEGVQVEVRLPVY